MVMLITRRDGISNHNNCLVASWLLINTEQIKSLLSVATQIQLRCLVLLNCSSTKGIASYIARDVLYSLIRCRSQAGGKRLLSLKLKTPIRQPQRKIYQSFSLASNQPIDILHSDRHRLISALQQNSKCVEDFS